ncbi:hypothetical protein [Microbacterium sp.]|uniref:hypothetical protein n=1 Tax=Microbacterium sp. TaxID=51671 RepID=UPI0035683849
MAAGAVVLEGSIIPDGSLVAGVPAKARRSLTEDERRSIIINAEQYQALALRHSSEYCQIVRTVVRTI